MTKKYNKSKKIQEKPSLIARPRIFDLRESEYSHEELLDYARENKLFLSSAEFKALFIDRAKHLLYNEDYPLMTSRRLYDQLVNFLVKDRFELCLPVVVDNFGSFVAELCTKNSCQERTKYTYKPRRYILIKFLICRKFKEYFDVNRQNFIKRSSKLIQEFIKMYGEIKLSSKR